MKFMVKDLAEAHDMLIETKDRGNHVLGHEKCYVCKNAVLMSVKVIPFKMFNCGHFYHSSCIENYENKCVKCATSDIEVKEKEKKTRRNRDPNDSGSTMDSNASELQSPASKFS